MTDTRKRISQLVIRKLKGTISHSDNTELEAWLADSEANRNWFDRLVHTKSSLARLLLTRSAEEGAVKGDWDKFAKKYFPDSINTANPAKVPVKVISWRRWFAVAASLIILVTSGISYWMIKVRSTPNTVPNLISSNDIPAPTGNNTVLTLGDGSRILLDSVGVGKLASQGKTDIKKTGKGQILYAPAKGSAASEILINTISTSYGGTSRVVLPDGSIVWINALSSLRFPNQFTGDIRAVDLTGEAYFEIAPDKNKPFHVRVGSTEIAVLGTHFDVMAYGNEKEQKVTLLEGSVKVRTGQLSSTLSPGEQAQVGAAVHISKNIEADQEVAWVGGKFKFHNEPLEPIMRQLERWYNIETTFEGHPSIQLSGSVSKTKNLSAVLELLRLSGVNCSIEGRKVIIKQ